MIEQFYFLVCLYYFLCWIDIKKYFFKIIYLECQFFIDYRSSQTGCDRSLRLGNELETKYGANIVEQPQASATTHIIFKNGNLQTKLFAKKHNIPLIDPMWLEHCIKKRRLIKIDKYQINNDENQQPAGKKNVENLITIILSVIIIQKLFLEEIALDQLVISNKNIILPSTPKSKVCFCL